MVTRDKLLTNHVLNLSFTFDFPVAAGSGSELSGVTGSESFSLEHSYTLPQGYALMLADTVLVTPTGARLLTGDTRCSDVIVAGVVTS